MSKLVVLELGEGDFEQHGFPVTLRITEDEKNSEINITGKLPPDPQVEESYVLWHSRYRRLGRLGSPMRLEDENTQVTNIGDHIRNPIDECKEAGQILSNTLNSWLKSSSFTTISKKFLQENKPDEEIRIILQTDDYLLQKLPWSDWELLTDYKNAEIAFSPRNYEKRKVANIKKKRQIKILAILGDSKNIDVEKDREILKGQLPDANIEFLVEPTRKQIDEQLREQGWDILFFAGHSESKDDSNEGWIKINKTDSLNIKDLRNTLNYAIEKGLSLAIFNSCDGLGLTAELSAMQIPQIIVMRESIPDVVAHEFLKYFLKAFARTHSLYLAVREGRERLQNLDEQFPCASWLPVIFQNPTYQPLIWVPRSYAPRFPMIMAASIAVASLVLGIRHLGWLQPLELKAYDQMMQLRSDKGIDHRILVVEVTEDDIKDDINTQDPKKRGWFSLSDVRMVRLLKEIKKYQPRAIGLDMYRDLPLDAKPSADLKKLFEENENLFAVCKVNESNGDVGGVPPATFIPKENLVFSDVLLDSDDVLRRHLLSIESHPPCIAENALSWELALQYLHNLHPKGIEPKNTPKGDVLLGKAHLKVLSKNAGGYQTFGKKGSDNKRLDYKNYQILLNYCTRSKVADFVSATTVLKQDKKDIDIAQLVKDRIVLIGVTTPSVTRPDGTPDVFQTPYGVPMRGVFIHAQMVSQLISAALGERPLLGVWSWWADGLWICGWSFVGGLIVWRIWGAVPVGVAITVAIAILSGSCFLLFVGGNWVPFVPSLLTLASSSGILICYSLYKKSTINT